MIVVLLVLCVLALAVLNLFQASRVHRLTRSREKWKDCCVANRRANEISEDVIRACRRDNMTMRTTWRDKSRQGAIARTMPRVLHGQKFRYRGDAFTVSGNDEFGRVVANGPLGKVGLFAESEIQVEGESDGNSKDSVAVDDDEESACRQSQDCGAKVRCCECGIGAVAAGECRTD